MGPVWDPCERHCAGLDEDGYDGCSEGEPSSERANLARIPAGRWGNPEDLKGAVVFPASSASDYMHDHILCVDGGYLAYSVPLSPSFAKYEGKTTLGVLQT